jgi:predicted ATPase/class 3 adenylate cyclase/DNA-binding XRE family transcriptional regulator
MVMVQAPDFSTLLRRYRRSAGLTQEELAERAGLSARGISDLERGLKHRPHRDTVQLLADALQLTGEDRGTFEAAGRLVGSTAQAAPIQPLEIEPRITGAEPATQVRIFLIADIRGYTVFTQERGDEEAARLSERFAELVVQVVEPRGGRLVELRGDEALVAFDSARQALRAAVEMQVRFAREADDVLPLRVGIGLDAGEAVAVGNGFRGGALNLAARLCSLAGVGEVFASETVIGLARKTVGVAYADRGEVSLKGLADPVRVVQIAPEGELPASLPPLQQILPARPNNLPDEPNLFIGREQEIAAVCALLERPGVRLVTLTGPAGVGKTRLAVQIGSAVLYKFNDGVFFVSLASIGDPELVASAIAETIGVKEVGGRALQETLRDHLRDKHLLLVLDNFEHLLEARSLAVDLLQACPKIKVLVTSREFLHLSREHDVEVPPLSIPDPGQLPDLASLLRYESVALFTYRAQAVKSTFALTDQNAPAVVEICRRLDGLPLAIELAAARIRMFSPETLLGRLSSRLGLLTGGPHDMPDRQQTLRRTLDWSYTLLDPAEQRLFARLAVFAGGCTLEDAQAVCLAAGDLQIEALDGVGSLVRKSLLRRDEVSEGESRFVMLETIHEYAAEQLDAIGETHEIRRRHAEHYLALAEQAEPELRGPQQAMWLRRLEREHDNLRTSLRWAIDCRDTERAFRLVVALGLFWMWRCKWTEARKWLKEALAQGDSAPGDLRVRALWMKGGMARVQGDYEQAEPLLKESLAQAEDLGEASVVAAALNQLGILAVHRGNRAEAAAFLERSLALARELEDKPGVAKVLDDLGVVAMYQGEWARATELLEESLTLYAELGDEARIADVRRDLSFLALHDGDPKRASELLVESLTFSRESGNTWLAITGLEGLARAATALGRAKRAARLWGAVEALSAGINISFPPDELASHERYLATARAQSDEVTFAGAWEEGRTMTLEVAIAYALEEGDD